MDRAKKTLVRQTMIGTLGLVGFLVIVWGAYRLVSPPAAQPIRPLPTSQPVVVKLVTGQAIVRPGKYFPVRFKIDPERMRDARVAGSFQASGGPHNDIQVVVAEESEFENWINGRPAHLLHSTGRVTQGHLDLAIPQAGTYALVFSNTFSPLEDKQVTAEIELRFFSR